MNKVRFRTEFWEGQEMPFLLVMSARSPLQRSTVTCALKPFLQFLNFPTKNPSTCTVVSWTEMTGYTHNGREHCPSCLFWCRCIYSFVSPISSLTIPFTVCSNQLGFHSWKEVWAADKTTMLSKTTLLFLAQIMHWFCFKCFFLIK